MSLRAHLLEAIALNRSRSQAYKELTGSASLSRNLVRMEQASLPIAVWLDLRSRKGRRRLLMERAFVPMDVYPMDRPPRFRGGVVPEGLVSDLAGFARAAWRCVRRGDLQHAVALAGVWLDELARREEAAGAHLAMSKHLVESIAHTCAVAAELHLHRDRLARDLIRVQLWALPLGPLLDRRAQRDHARGVGILVNDLPDIVAVRNRTASRHFLAK